MKVLGNRNLFLLVSVAVSLTLGFYGPANADEMSELSELREQLAQQHQVMRALENRMVELEAQEQERKESGLDFGFAAGARKKGFAPEDVYDNGFFIRSKDGKYSLNVNGFLQARYTLTTPDKGRSRNNFDVALARLAFSGSVFDPKVKYFFQYEATTFGNSNRSTMLDWWMQYSYSQYLNIQAGRFILPYSRQFYTHPGNLLFSDLSAADYAFNLQRAGGANVSGKMGKLSYHGVVTNSIRALDAGGQQNQGGEVAWQGRLEYDVLDPYGYLESSPTPAQTPQLSIGIAAAFNPVDEGSGFQNVRDGDRTTNVTIDGGFRYQGFTLQGAGYFRRNNHHYVSETGHDWGYYGQLGYYLTDKLELAGRVSGVDFQFANNTRTAGDHREYTGGFNYYLYGHNVKLQVDYSFLDGDPFSAKSTSASRFRVQTQVLF